VEAANQEPGATPVARRHKAYFVTAEDRIRRETIRRVICDRSLDLAAMSTKLGVNFEGHCSPTNSPRSPNWRHTAWCAVCRVAWK
jgi:hypothetical protein